MSFQTRYISSLTADLTTTATTIAVKALPTAPAGRMALVNGNIYEWISYTGISGTPGSAGNLTGVTRMLSQTADPVTGGTGLFWGAGTTIFLTAMHDQISDKELPFPIVGYTTAQKNALDMSSDYFTGTYPIIYDTTLGQYQYYTGAAWTSFASGTVADASTTVGGKVKTTVSPTGTGTALITDDPKYSALAGTSGTAPSGSNKFVDDADTATAATANKVARRGATGNVTVITETPGTSNTQAASTAFVGAAIAAAAPKIFAQPIVLDGTTTGGNVNASTATTGASTTEPVFATASGSGGATKILRFEVRTDGTLVQTHTASITNSSATDTAYVAVLGSFVYTITNNGGAPVKLTRFAKADLSGQTLMTISGTALVNGGLYSDGTSLYNLSSAGNARVYTVSGTTATSGATTAYTSAVVLDPYWCDGTSVYSISSGTCYKWALAGGARTTGTALFTSQYLIAGGTLGAVGGIFKENGNTSYIHTIFTNTGSNIQSGKLIPVTTF